MVYAFKCFAFIKLFFYWNGIDNIYEFNDVLTMKYCNNA